MEQHDGDEPQGGGDQPPVLTPFTVGGPTPSVASAEPVIASRPSRGRTLGVILSVFALVAASGFVIANFGSSDGSDTPEAAVEKLFDALEQRDIIGLLEVLPPSERSVLKDPVLDTVRELQRLEILSDFDLSGVPGFTIDVEGLELASTELGGGVAAVSIEGGTISGTVDPEQLPLGDLVRDLMDEDAEDAASDEEGTMEPEDLAEADVELVTVQEADGWHVSLWYTVAEAARGDDSEVPDFGNSTIAAVGADSPEGAVRGLLDAASDLDLAGVIGMLPPDEMRVLYDYAPLWLDDANEAADEVREDGFFLDIEELELKVQGSGGVRRVGFESFAVSAGADDGATMHATYGDGCFSMEITYEDEWDSWDGESLENTFEVCDDGEFLVDGEPIEAGDDDSPFFMVPDPSGLLPDLEESDEMLAALTVVEKDGRWYVSPTRSVFDPVLTLMRSIDADDLREFIEGMEDWFTDAEMQFEDVGGSIGGLGAECYEAWDELPDDASDEEWDAVQEEVDSCLEDAGVDTSFPGDECYEATDELPFDATDEEWEAAQEEVDACLEEAGVDTSFPGDECQALWDELPDDASGEEWEAAQAEIDACLEDAGVDMPDPDDLGDVDELGSDDAFVNCALEMMPDETETGVGDMWSDESLAMVEDLLDCVEAEDSDHAIIECLQTGLDLADASPAEQEAAEPEIEACMDEAMSDVGGDIEFDSSSSNEGSFESYPPESTLPPPQTTSP